MMGNNHGSCKIGFIASSGGHWEELMCLKEIAKTYNSFFVTEEGGQAKDTNLQNIYILKQINRREKAFIIHFIKLFIEYGGKYMNNTKALTDVDISASVDNILLRLVH